MAKAKVLIAGAGLGGLAAAACLLKRGHDVHVYEQAPVLGEVGAGVQQSANSVKVLYDLGLQKELDTWGVRPETYEYRRYDTGELLHSMPFAGQHLEQFGAPYYHLHRADFHKILVDKVNALKPNAITLNAKAVGYTEDADGVTLKFADGQTARGDVLVGADGIKSAIRAQIAGEAKATYTGYCAWRVTVPREKLPADIMPIVGQVWCGPKNHAVVYWLRAGQIFNFVGCPRQADWSDESWTAKRPWEAFKADYAGWHPKIQAIVDAADRDQCFYWALNNRKPIYDWSTQRATLLGDAAHPTLPFLAQGACMAVEDGAILARALDGAASIAEGLQIYQRARIDRCARVVNESTEHGGLYHIVDADEMRKAFKEKNISKERAQWLYPYDPLTVPLN